VEVASEMREFSKTPNSDTLHEQLFAVTTKINSTATKSTRLNPRKT